MEVLEMKNTVSKMKFSLGGINSIRYCRRKEE